MYIPVYNGSPNGGKHSNITWAARKAGGLARCRPCSLLEATVSFPQTDTLCVHRRPSYQRGKTRRSTGCAIAENHCDRQGRRCGRTGVAVSTSFLSPPARGLTYLHTLVRWYKETCAKEGALGARAARGGNGAKVSGLYFFSAMPLSLFAFDERGLGHGGIPIGDPCQELANRQPRPHSQAACHNSWQACPFMRWGTGADVQMCKCGFAAGRLAAVAISLII